MKIYVCLVLPTLISMAGIAQTEASTTQLHDPSVLVGELGEKLGTVLSVKGVIVEGPLKGYEGGPNLLIRVINDRSTQVPVQIPVSPYFGQFGTAPLPKLETDSTYSLRVYETDRFVGIPSGAYKEAGIILQSSGFYFKNSLVVISAEKIRPIELSPVNFIGRYALLSGIAKNQHDTAVLVGSNWTLKLKGCEKWKKSETGKAAEVYGEIREAGSKNSYDVTDCRQRLINLEDQVGKTVKLRGRAISMNGEWWFNYRGIDVSVEKMKELMNFGDHHFEPMEISGTLEKSKVNDNCNTEYIVRNASWAPIKELLIPELYLQK